MIQPTNDKIKDDLAAQLKAQGLLIGKSKWEPLSGGRTNWIWRVTAPDMDVVVKLYANDHINPLFPNDPTSEIFVLRHLKDHDIAPRLLDHITTSLGECLIYAHIEGEPWSTNTARVATLLQQVHMLTPPPGLRHVADGSDALRKQTLDILSECSVDARQAAFKLEPQNLVFASGKSCLLHGDPVAGNIIVQPRGLRLIDWQCPATGDPCEDLSLFLSPAMQLTYRGRVLTDEEEHNFLNAYQDHVIVKRYHQLAPWYHWRMIAYCLWKQEHGDIQASAAVLAETKALCDTVKHLALSV